MKKISSIFLLAAVATLLTPSPSTRAQGTLHVDASGNPTTTFNLSGANVVGTLSPADTPTDPTFYTLTVNQQATFNGPVLVPPPIPTDNSLKAANTQFVQAVVANARTGDGSGLTNLNAAALSTGTAAPARLGTGTPSSATVLRGDGSWVGTTPTGSTLPATGNLLMGDGAGNAAAVASGSDLYRVLTARAERALVNAAPPVNLLAAAVFHGTLNADGTITVPAGGNVYWTGLPGSTPTFPLYGCAVAVGDAPSGAITVHGNYGADFASTDSTPEPGVYHSVFQSSTYTLYNVFIRNSSGADITIFFPVVSATDTGLAAQQSFADATAVAVQPVSDLDFTHFASADRTGRYAAEKQTTLAADSVTGVDANAGTLYAPRLTLSTQTLATGALFGLYRGSLFRNSLPLAALGNTHGIGVQDLAFGSTKNLPIVSALDLAPNGSFTANGDGTYSYLWTPTDSTVANDGYSNVYVVEIDTTTEAAAPVASRHRLMDVADEGDVEDMPGAAFVQSLGSNQWKVTLLPSDRLAPGSGSYRYEVVSRVAPANWGAPGNLGDGSTSGLELVGGSNGYGALAGPTGFVGDRLAILHCTTHGAVLGGGSLQRSVFYEMGDAQSIQLAWYAASPAGTLRWTTDHCLFYANVGNRIPYGLISHSSDGTNYDRGDLADCAFLGARLADGSLQGTAIDYVNVANGLIDRVYAQGFADSFGTGMPAGVEIRHSLFRQVCHTMIGSQAFHDNLVAAESGSNPADPNYRSPSGFTIRSAGAVVKNNLFWAHGLPTAVTNDTQATGFSFYPGVATGSATHNVIVVDPATPATQGLYTQLPNPTSGLTLDYNLVIFTGPFGASGAVNWTSWAAYQAANPTLDAHSLFVDLSSDPRGINAVFANAAAGDFRWAQTAVARRCAAYCAANHVGPATVPSRWPYVPAVDEAVRMIEDL